MVPVTSVSSVYGLSAITDSAMIASIIVLFGLPITVGFRLLANTNGDDMAPEPGQVVPAVGYVASSFVRMK